MKNTKFMRRYGDTKTSLTLSPEAERIYTDTDPLSIFEELIEDAAGNREYRYSIRGCFGDYDDLTEEEVNARLLALAEEISEEPDPLGLADVGPFDPERVTVSFSNFSALISDASEFSDFEEYFAECTSSICAEISVDRARRLLKAIWIYRHDGFRALREACELTRKQAHMILRIPPRSIENWEASGERTYTLDLAAYALLGEFDLI